jgi:glucose/arabinose dehydrogenase
VKRACIVALGCLAGLASPASANITTETVGTFASPTHVTAPPQDVSRVFVVEKQGIVRVVVDGVVQPTPFLDLESLVPDSPPDEDPGMFSLAFAPDYAASGRFYVFYIALDGSGRVDELRRSANDPNVADPASRRPVLTIPFHAWPAHYGGQLAFDASGDLFVSVGDGEAAANPNGNPQALGNLFGKILRIRPVQSGSHPYTVPASNPYVGRAGARPEIWAYGLRNPFRFSFDRLKGDLVIGDVGRNNFEEVDYVPRSESTGRGRNFGWSECEGYSEYTPQPDPGPCDLTGRTDPVFVRSHTDGVCSIIGGFVVRDASLEELRGRYLYGDYCNPDLRQLRLGLPAASGDATVGDPPVQLSSVQSFGEDACGRIYAAEGTGAVKRLVDGSSACTTPLGLPPAQPLPRRPAKKPAPTPAAPKPAPDLRALRLGIRAVGGLRRRGVVLRVRCNERCSVRASGGRLRAARAALAAHRVKVLRLRLTRRGRAALRRHKRLRVRVHVRARDRAGDLTRRSLMVRSRR